MTVNILSRKVGLQSFWTTPMSSQESQAICLFFMSNEKKKKIEKGHALTSVWLGLLGKFIRYNTFPGNANASRVERF